MGMVLSENLIQLSFAEVTSLSSFLLIAYKHEAHDARISARMAAVTGGGGLALLAGVMLIGSMAGSYDLSVVLSQDSIRASGLYPSSRSHSCRSIHQVRGFLPFLVAERVAAQTPVSAYLHSATM